MKIKHIYLAAALLFAACTTEENTELADSRIPIEFTATCVSNATRATVDNNWRGHNESGELVAVKIGDVVKPYKIGRIDGATGEDADNLAKLSSDDPHYWTGKTETITAWYPYTPGEQNPPEVVVKEDQREFFSGYVASDYIIAEQEVTFVSGQLPALEFTHRTADIKIDLVSGKGTEYLSPTVTISINGTNITTCKYTPGSREDKDAHPNQFHALLPQGTTVAAGDLIITVMFNVGQQSGNTYKFSNKTAQTFEAGSQYSYTLTVDE